MKNLLKVAGNAILVVGGFFIILFSTSKFSAHKQPSLASDMDSSGVAHADAAVSSGGGGDSGVTGDSGGGDCGGDGGDGGDGGK